MRRAAEHRRGSLQAEDTRKIEDVDTRTSSEIAVILHCILYSADVSRNSCVHGLSTYFSCYILQPAVLLSSLWLFKMENLLKLSSLHLYYGN